MKINEDICSLVKMNGHREKRNACHGFGSVAKQALEGEEVRIETIGAYTSGYHIPPRSVGDETTKPMKGGGRFTNYKT